MAQDRPTASELLTAIADFLREEATPALDRSDPRLGFQMRVAVNSLAILEREVRLGPAADAREHDRLTKLLGHKATLDELNQELARQLRTGERDESGVTAILDWEGAHLGDPVEDLGWLCVKSWRFGAVDKPAGGFGTREELWGAYERAGGGKVDPVRAHWWEVLGTARWGIICHQQAWRHLSGAVRSMELAAIGRRAVETEVDLLQLLKEKT